MFELSEFYDYCRENRVDVIPFAGVPQPGATIRDRGQIAVFLDFTKIMSTRTLRGVCFHELGHAATGALHKLDSPYEMVERSEHRANRWMAEHFLTREDFAQAFSAGFTQLWQLAEYFDLPEEQVADAYNYWSENKGVDFNMAQMDLRGAQNDR